MGSRSKNLCGTRFLLEKTLVDPGYYPKWPHPKSKVGSLLDFFSARKHAYCRHHLISTLEPPVRDQPKCKDWVVAYERCSLQESNHTGGFFPVQAHCWFSQSNYKTISILLRFYFHGVLEHLKTNFRTNFRFKRVLGFVIEYAWISKLLRDAAFTWRPRELSWKWLFSRNFAIKTVQVLEKVLVNVYEFL